MRNIKHLLDVVDAVRDDVALGLMSDPGLSKTSQVKEWAKENGRSYYELIISQRMPSEISGMPMPVSESRTMEIFDFDTLLKLEDGDVLAFDEFTNGNIQTLNACLTLIQERTMLSGKELPSILVVAMGNPQGRCDLLPQTKQRFWWVDVIWDQTTWVNYMKREWGIKPHSELLRLITNQYQNGFNDPSQYNYYTPRTVENLIRIAKVVDRHDSFWEASNIRAEVVAALYDTLDMVDPFNDVKDRVLQWFKDNGPLTNPNGGMETKETLDLMTRVAECNTIAELRETIDLIEKNGWAPELIEFLKSADEEEPDTETEEEVKTL